MKPTFAAIVLALIALAGRLAATGASPPAAEPPRPAPPPAIPARLIVHEWGTFTSFSGSNGVPIKFQPDNSSLPGFVYHHGNDPEDKARLMIAKGTIGMETPVLYFYTDRPLRASVRVGFPKGWITEWYPSAAWPPDERIYVKGRNFSDPGESILWEVKLLPGESLNPDSGPAAKTGLPVGHWAIEFANGVTEACEIRGNGAASVVKPDRGFYRSFAGNAEAKDGATVIKFEDDRVERWKPKGDRFTVELWAASNQFPAGTPVLGLARKNPYFHARETDSVLLEATFIGGNGPITQREKFLFYRGVGAFPPPLTVRAEGGGKVRVSNAAGGKVTGMVLVVVRDGRFGFQAVNDLEAGREAVATLPETTASLAELGTTMEKSLVAAGLYEREARAMVKTWDHAWFHDEGARLLYIVPRAKTDELLPLTVNPAPTQVERVIVGRHDFLTPEQEAAIQAQVARLRAAQAEQAADQAELNKLGRFSSQAVHQAEERLAKEKK